MVKQSTKENKMVKQFLTAFLFTLAYAVIRYAGFGHVSLDHLPVYIMNKAICMTGVEAMFMAALCLMQERRTQPVSGRMHVRSWCSFTSFCRSGFFRRDITSISLTVTR